MKKPMRAKCAKCGDIVEVSHYHEFKSCKCGAIFLDYGDGYYSRTGGAPENFDKEFDKEQGIDRFKPFKGEQLLQPLDTNTDFYIAKNPDDALYIQESIDDLVKEVIEWGEQHQINNPWTQASKVVEEWGETVSEMNHNRFGEEFEDGIGDTLITLIIFAHIHNKDVRDCLEKSLRTIQKRTGTTLNGNFIKEEK